MTTWQKLKLAFSASRIMIAQAEERQISAIDSEDWQRAADLQRYISGMKQILILFEQSVNEDEL